MGRYSRLLAESFADFGGVTVGQVALDVGCGPGALTRVLAARLGADAVWACDPSQPFVADCAAACPGADVRLAGAEAMPYDDAQFDVALAQLVLHFVTEPTSAAAELRRVVRPGGIVAACVWDFAEGMEMLRHFWDSALTVDPRAPDEASVMRFGREGEIAELFADAGLENVGETSLGVTVEYRDFDELWSGFLAGIGPAGSYCVSLDDADRESVRRELFRRVGAPAGAFVLGASARSARGEVAG